MLRQIAELNRVIRKGLTEKIFEQKLRGCKRKENFKGVQRPKGGREPGMFKKKPGGQGGW